MFSMYCQRKFEVEPVEVIYSDGKSHICPELSPYHMEVSLAYINGIAGVSLEANKVQNMPCHHLVFYLNACVFMISIDTPYTHFSYFHVVMA